jgi:hypothetical protein
VSVFNLGDFAGKVGTTLEQLYQDNPGLKKIENRLPATRTIFYHKAKEVPGEWYPWDYAAASRYNVGDSRYKEKVERNYTKILKKW